MAKTVEYLRVKEQLDEMDENPTTSKILTLLSSTCIDKQRKALCLFNDLPSEEKLTFTSRLIEHRGSNPYIIDGDVSKLGEATDEDACVQFYWPTQFRFCDWMDDYIDWMLAMANDPRWFEAEKLHIQNLMVTDAFTVEMQTQLLAHLLHHPNLTELRLMRSEQNSKSLLADLEKFGAKGDIFAETVERLRTLTDLETSSRYHPILKAFVIERLTLIGPDSRESLHLLNAYNPYTTRWASPYWSDSLSLHVNDTSFTKLQSLKLINASQIEQVSIQSSQLKDVSITDCKGLTRVAIHDALMKVVIDDCPALWKLDIVKPSFFNLGQDLHNGLGCKVDGTTADWEIQFDQLMDLQRDMLIIEAWEDSSFFNDYFGAYEYFGPKFYVNPAFFMSWFSTQLHGEDSPGPKKVAENTDGLMGYPNNGIHNIEEYSNAYHGYSDAIFDRDWCAYNIEVTRTRTPVNPETDDKIDVMGDVIYEYLEEHVSIDRSNDFWSHGNLDIHDVFMEIAPTLEKEELWAWIETWPEEIKIVLQKL